MAVEWRWKECAICRGYGVVSDYSGGDFQGAKDCDACMDGIYFITPTGRCAAWPGGPFCGRTDREDWESAKALAELGKP